MSKFTQEQETQIVKDARDLTATIEFEQRELQKVKSEQFKALPQEPIRKVVAPVQPVQPQYPQKPKTNYTWADFVKEDVKSKNKILVILCILCMWPVSIYILYSFFGFSKKLKELNDELAKDPKYLQAIEDAEKIAKEKQTQAENAAKVQQDSFDKQYEEAKKQYDNEIVPKYKEEFALWSDLRERKIAILEEEIKLNEETLASLYNESKIISSTYRQLGILCWLYEDMSTSDHDIRYATELLDRDRQRIVTQEAGRMVQRSVSNMEQTMMQGFNAVYNAIEDGNDLQAETIDILSKTRRDMRAGDFIGTVQRHNTNKKLDEMLEMRKK